MNLETLMDFCSKDEVRTSISQPWVSGGHIYATDGSVLVCIRADDHPEIVESLDPQDNPINAAKVFNESPIAKEWFPVPFCLPPEDPKEVICDECDGKGVSECVTCGQERPCPDCEVEGKSTPKRIDSCINIGGVDFSNYYLHLIKKYFPNAEIGPAKYLKPSRLRFDGGVGLLMPMRNVTK